MANVEDSDNKNASKPSSESAALEAITDYIEEAEFKNKAQSNVCIIKYDVLISQYK